LTSLLSELTGTDQSLLDVHRLLIHSSLDRLQKGSADNASKEPEIDWISYSRFVDVPEKLLDIRNLNPSFARMYGVRWDTDNKCWVIPIVSATGELLGWQSKKKGWVRNYPVGVKKSETLFGVERFTSKVAVLMESPLDVVRMHSLYPDTQGLATFGAYVSRSQINLLSMVASRVIIAMDNDEAGIEASKRIAKMLPRFKNGVAWANYSSTNAKDIGDMSDDEIITSIQTATAIPRWS
jgi:5S rRNA maturation endonuclease (ribonuclease M5)